MVLRSLEQKKGMLSLPKTGAAKKKPVAVTAYLPDCVKTFRFNPDGNIIQRLLYILCSIAYATLCLNFNNNFRFQSIHL